MRTLRSWTYVVKFDGMEILKPISFDLKRMVKAKSDWILWDDFAIIP